MPHEPNSPARDMARLGVDAMQVVDRACDLARELLQTPTPGWQKADDSPVTRVDIEVDRFLHSHLRPLFPSAGWLSEETADDAARLGLRHVWVVDPIDGTRSMLAGHPEFCVSVALVETGVGPVLGLIANPMTGERFMATLGGGAFDGTGQRLQVRTTAAAERLDVLVSRSDLAKGVWGGLRDEHELTPLGSLAYKMALVAAGAYDGHATPTPRSEWDAAAGALILSEAGGRTTDLHGRPLRFNQPAPTYDGVIVASEAAYARILAIGQRTAQTYARLRGG